MQNNDIEIYSTHNEEKSVVAERFIRTLKNKIFKYMIQISKNVYVYKLDDVVNKYNNTYHKTTKIKPADIKSNKYINLIKKLIIKVLNLKKNDIVTILKYKLFLQNLTVQFDVKGFHDIHDMLFYDIMIFLKKLYRRHVILVILMGKKLLKY